MEKVGKEGVITIQDGKTTKDELEVIEGMKVESGYISHMFITDTKTSKVVRNLRSNERCVRKVVTPVQELEDVLILLSDKKLSSVQSVIPALEKAIQARRKLLIIAESVEGDALTTLIINRVRGTQVLNNIVIGVFFMWLMYYCLVVCHQISWFR